jgi:thiamine biosynthesis lipoprotein ApbE
LPTPAQVAAARQRVDWRALQLSPARVALQRPGMAVTLNGLAQGYAADLALQALHKHGITQALLDTGEFTTLGDKADGQPWRLGIRHPRQADTPVARLRMDGRALATSGDYETFFSADFAPPPHLRPRHRRFAARAGQRQRAGSHGAAGRRAVHRLHGHRAGACAGAGDGR